MSTFTKQSTVSIIYLSYQCVPLVLIRSPRPCHLPCLLAINSLREEHILSPDAYTADQLTGLVGVIAAVTPDNVMPMAEAITLWAEQVDLPVIVRFPRTSVPCFAPYWPQHQIKGGWISGDGFQTMVAELFEDDQSITLLGNDEPLGAVMSVRRRVSRWQAEHQSLSRDTLEIRRGRGPACLWSVNLDGVYTSVNFLEPGLAGHLPDVRVGNRIDQWANSGTMKTPVTRSKLYIKAKQGQRVNFLAHINSLWYHGVLQPQTDTNGRIVGVQGHTVKIPGRVVLSPSL
jgi:hypothetical protein